jgi:GNAT superfamily N-acetyltransferase
MIEKIDIKVLNAADLVLYYDDFFNLFSENTKGHEIERVIDDSYIELKAKEIFQYLESGSAFFVGAFSQNILIGFIWGYKRIFFEEKRIYINSMIINKIYRGKKIGSMLLNELERLALSNNIYVLDVATASFKNDAINFYLKHGFISERIQFRKKII